MRVAATSGDNSDQMDVDTAVGSSLSVGKCKHSDLPGDNVLAHDNHELHHLLFRLLTVFLRFRPLCPLHPPAVSVHLPTL